MKLLFLIATLLASPCISFAQIPLNDVQTIEGPWEFTSATGIDGVFISFNSFLNDRSGQMAINTQSINIRVYHRQNGIERQGYFSPGDSSTSSVVIDAWHLTMSFSGHTEVGPFAIDLRFDPAAHHWSGNWNSEGKPRDVALERPHLTSAVPSQFVGDWVGEATHFAPATLHIRQSSDGQFVGWLDRSLSTFDPHTNLHSTDQRNAELLTVTTADKSKLQLKTTNAFGNAYVYDGAIADDGKTLTGSWPSVDGGSGRLNAPGNFTRSE